ncbi:MAG: flagella basal body P-ring formation protein FlgA [Deltaproteobacteria bacterium]|nr:MAG: flagella basal body P-ring formation protein FlgA [Deltaproteobacteria bacterium]
MKRIILIAIFIMLGVPPLFGGEIIFHRFINTSKEKIRLGDVARIKGCNSDWKDILLAHINTPGTTIELPAGYIKARLKLNGVPVEGLRLHIPEVVKIKRQAIRISKKDLIAITRRCIMENNPWGNKLKIIQIRPTNDLILPKGRLSYSCQLNGSPLGSFSVPIIFKVNGRIVSRTWVMAKTSLITPVIISACPIRRGEMITRDKIRIIKRDVSRLLAGIFFNKEAVIGKRARINIGADKVIYKNMVEIPPVIRRGQRVTIVAESESLKITAPGKAKQDGRLGDIIKVENLLSKKVIVGKVVDNQTIKVKF